MRVLRTATFAVVLWVAGGATASADVQLTIRDGLVTLVARDATVRQILTEWARVGQTKIVNVDRIPGAPITLQLTNVPEEQALDVLLRSVSGYMAAPRPAAIAGLSRYDRILVMPTSVAPRVPTAAPRAVPQQSPFGLPGQATDGLEDDDEQGAPGAVVPGRPPVFGGFPRPQFNPQPGGPGTVPVPAAIGGVPQQQGAPTQTPPASYSPQPTMPSGGVAVPGMIVPAPTQPGQLQPGQVQPAPPQPSPRGQANPEGN